MALSEKGKQLEQRDALISVGVGTLAVIAAWWFGPEAQSPWWVYVVIFVAVAVAAFQVQIKSRGDRERAYGRE